MLMYKHSSSIKSAFVGLTKGERTDDCDKGSTSDDSIKSVFGESTDGEMINDCNKSSSSDDEVDVLVFLGDDLQSHNLWDLCRLRHL